MRRARPGGGEFLAIVAMSMALVALGIDTMLPAFADIRASFGLAPDSNAVAGLVTAYFLGLAVGQLGFGPWSDRAGRKPMLWAGFALYALGALGTALAPGLTAALIARFVWGLGASGPRAVAMAVIRDSYEGERMSRAISMVMALFLLVPVVGPALGAAVLVVADWRWLFGLGVVAAAVMFVWSLRLPETLPVERRLPRRRGAMVHAARAVFGNRQTVCFLGALTAVYGVFTAYLGSSQAIFDETFGRGDSFPLYFGALAAVMGVAMLGNARAVTRYGTRRLARVIMGVYVAGAATFVAVTFATGGHPPLWAFLANTAVLLACHAFITPNFNTLAMAPMGHIAGTAAAVLGAVQTAVAALCGAVIDRSFDGTPRALAAGYLISAVLATALSRLAVAGVPDPGPAPRLAAPAEAAH